MLTDEIIIGTAEFFSDHKGVEQKDIVEFARAIEAAACAPLLERIAKLEGEIQEYALQALSDFGQMQDAVPAAPEQQAEAPPPVTGWVPPRFLRQD